MAGKTDRPVRGVGVVFGGRGVTQGAGWPEKINEGGASSRLSRHSRVICSPWTRNGMCKMLAMTHCRILDRLFLNIIANIFLIILSGKNCVVLLCDMPVVFNMFRFIQSCYLICFGQNSRFSVICSPICTSLFFFLAKVFCFHFICCPCARQALNSECESRGG